jgi:hypothetical protein
MTPLRPPLRLTLKFENFFTRINEIFILKIKVISCYFGTKNTGIYSAPLKSECYFFSNNNNLKKFFMYF